jgi:predicted dehydrogenase
MSVRAEVGEYLPDWHPWEDYRESYSGRRELGGGPILTFSHELDAVCWLLGAPTAVTAIAAHGSGLEIDTEDVAEIILEFSSGALASVHVDYVRRPPRRVIEVVGDEGTLRWEPNAQRLLHFVPGTGEPRQEDDDPRFNRNNMFLNELQEFVQRVRGGSATAGATGEQGAAILAIALAALRSAAEGRRIDLSLEPDPVRQWLLTL